MAKTHELIQRQVKLDWSAKNRGRLFDMRQGMGVPIGGENPIWFGNVKGFSDLFGDETPKLCDFIGKCINETADFCPECPLDSSITISCYIEVKTLAYSKLSEDQVDFMNGQSARGARCYVAMEREDKSEKMYDLIKWEDWEQ